MKIRPFCGWHYPAGDVSNVIAPPYDILDQGQKDALEAKSATNIVTIDLPFMPPKALGPEEVYIAAAKRLVEWQTSGVLVQDEAPAMYCYEQTYTWAGQTYTRRAILAGVFATALGEDVIPHEHTFDGPKADRLMLTQTTGTQMSPIFGFYDDPQKCYDLLRAAAPAEPTITGEMDDVKEALWVVTDEAAIATVQAALAETPAYIADGHHRYSTAMNHAKALREAGEIDAEHEANFVMFCLVARDDPGLLVLPTHRVLCGLVDGFSIESLVGKLDGFEVQKLAPGADFTDADDALSEFGPATIALLIGEDAWALTLTDPQQMVAAAPDECDAWRELDVAILHTLLIEKALGEFQGPNFDIVYTPDGTIAKTMVTSGQADAALVLQGTPVSAVEAVADAGASMPHKSTYFYPKLATGIILKPIQ